MRGQLSRGFTLIEVLVTLVILTFGLLGIAGLMAKGQRIAFEAFQRQQAVALAADMSERIHGNRLLASVCPLAAPGCTTYTAGAPVNAPLGASLFYNQYRTGLLTDCATLACTAAQLALFDIAMWDGLLNGYSEQQVGSVTRTGTIVGARGCIAELSNSLATCPAAPAPATSIYASTIRISVTWQGNDDTAPPAGANTACAVNQYGAETKRRIVTYDLLVQQPCP